MLIELTKHIKVVRPEARAAFPYSNSVFIDDDVKVMIDAGAGGRAYADTPVEAIQLLLLTHHHFDHTHGISFFTNARKMAGREELWAYQDEAKFIYSSGFHRWQELMGSPRDENEVRIQGLPPDVVALPGFHAVDIAGVFKDGDIFEVGETSFTAIHTPGHSPGHYAFFFPKESILFSADLDISPLGPWYGGHYCDLDELIQSIHKLIALKPQVLVSSHRRVLYSEIDDLMHAYLNIALQREEKILSYLCEPRTICDIADQGFINEWNQRSLRSQRTLFWHKMMIDKHLQRLQKLGLIARTPENKYICI